MHKSFSNWHNKKQKIDREDRNKFYHQREIWWCYLGINIGNEQNGSGSNF